MCYSEANEYENILSIYDNDSKGKLQIRLIKKTNNPWMYVMVSLPFKTAEKKCQLTYKRSYTAFDQIFESIQGIISQNTSHPELFRFIHKHRWDFCDVKKHHLDTNNIYPNGMSTTDKCLSACIEESHSRNRDDKYGNCKRKASDDNSSTE